MAFLFPRTIKVTLKIKRNSYLFPCLKWKQPTVTWAQTGNKLFGRTATYIPQFTFQQSGNLLCQEVHPDAKVHGDTMDFLSMCVYTLQVGDVLGYQNLTCSSKSGATLCLHLTTWLFPSQQQSRFPVENFDSTNVHRIKSKKISGLTAKK